MNPIPLTDPAGVVRAYACGECGNSYGSGASHRGGRPVDIALYAKWANGRAERCCRCVDCGEPSSDTICAACSAAWKAWARWLNFAQAWRDIGEAAYREIGSADEWDEYQRALEELDR